MDLFAASMFPRVAGGYRVILADPPWHFRLHSEKGEAKSPQAHYETMPIEEICALPVRGLADPAGCALVLWCTAPTLQLGMRVLEAWGFAYSSAGAWAKQGRAGGGWTFGTGYRYRSAAEFWLLGTMGQPTQKARNIRNLIVAPVREHSRKPDQMHEAIERQWPGPYVELFARHRRPGWDAWGNQVDRFEGAA
jgi:N6-adenosine-specific RNA methylase IME4